MAQIKCNDLAVGYDGEAIASHLNFAVEAGSYLCIVGENGSGKSTLMKTILGLRQPIAGEILFDDGLTPGEIGYLPQRTEVQRDFPASVLEVVLSGCLSRNGYRPFYGRAQRSLAMENLEKLGAEALAGRCFRELSGGQQQRVLLARALCAARKLLLLDEPVAGLDPTATEEMYRLIDDLNRQGITIIMVSHDLTAALRYATHVLHIGHKTYFFGTRDEYGAAGPGRDLLRGLQEDRHA